MAVIEVGELTVKAAAVEPNRTEPAPLKLTPVMVTEAPAAAAPEPGLTPPTDGPEETPRPETVGMPVAAVNVKWSDAEVAEAPQGVTTVTSLVPAGATGLVAVIEESELTVNGADTPPNRTAVAPVRLAPE